MLHFSFFSCKKEDPMIENYLRAKVGGVDWKAETGIYKDNYSDTLVLFGRSTNPREAQLQMRFVFRGIGSYILKQDQAKYYLLLGGDAIIGDFRIPSNREGVLNITKYDSKKKKVEGNFEMVMQPSNSSPSDTILLPITSGSFRSDIP